MTAITLDGISARTPSGWDARIYRRPSAGGESSHCVLHGANFALPPGMGDYGSGAVETMGSSDVLIALLEFDPSDADSALFGRSGLPEALDPAAFSSSSLQRALPRQAGLQVFFNQSRRAFCLYVVLGSSTARPRLASLANRFLAGITIGAGG